MKKSLNQTALEADEQREREANEARAKALGEGEAPPRAELHTWPDGSQAIGVPPFPEKSPKERAEVVEEDAIVASAVVPAGMPRSGEAAPVVARGITESQFKAKAEQQLESDYISGHDPHTVNPTSASDKPELANTDGTAGLESPDDVIENPTPEELAKIAAAIEPQGNFTPTDEQKAAAVAQVARETLGPIYPDEDTSKTTSKSKKR